MERVDVPAVHFVQNDYFAQSGDDAALAERYAMNQDHNPHMSASELRAGISDAIGRVSYGGERIVIEKNGKPAAVLISVQDLELLEALEDARDLAAIEAIRDEETVPWEQVKRDLGL
jgi:prevent-host-death family protein